MAEENYLLKVSQVLSLALLSLVDMMPEELFRLPQEKRNLVWKAVWEAVETGERDIFKLFTAAHTALHALILAQDEGQNDDRG